MEDGNGVHNDEEEEIKIRQRLFKFHPLSQESLSPSISLSSSLVQLLCRFIYCQCLRLHICLRFGI